MIVYGPTEEPLDPVRYLTNRSTGVMGKKLVSAAQKKGHAVVSVECPKDARTASDLLRLLRKLSRKCDVLIMAAAVCDFRPALVSLSKIKKNTALTLRLLKNPDILATLASHKKESQVFIGFAVESSAPKKYAILKMKKKKLDAIVVQKVGEGHNPFGPVLSSGTFLFSKGVSVPFQGWPKARVAATLIRVAENILKQR